MDKFISESIKCKTMEEFSKLVKEYSTNNFNFCEGKYNDEVQKSRYFYPSFKDDLQLNHEYSYYNTTTRMYDRNYICFPIHYNKPFYWFSLTDKVAYIGEAQIVLDETKDLTKCKKENEDNYWHKEYYHRSCGKLSITWKKVKRTSKSGVYLQPLNDILNYVELVYNTWYAKWVIEKLTTMKKSFYDIPFLVTHPELELLSKMCINETTGLPLASTIIEKQEVGYYYTYITDSDRVLWNRNFKDGKNIKEITNLPSNILKFLWKKEDIRTWDAVRKMMELRKCTSDDIIRGFNNNYRGDQLNKIDEILRAKWENKPVFSYTTLLNYLDRLDVNEAITTDCALELIRDSLIMARQINEEPVFIEKDSLKREHDLLMRKQKEIRDEHIIKEIKNHYNDKYYFEDEHYLVRQIRDYDDLMDEGNQQNNCLRYAYAKRIADGSSLIYVMRKKESPDTSLISIEIDPTGEFVRQKYLAYNRTIENKNQLQFLTKWDKFRQKINAKEDICASLV